MLSEAVEMSIVRGEEEPFAEQYKRVSERRADYISAKIVHAEPDILDERRTALNEAVARVAEGYRQVWLKDKREGTAKDEDLDKIGVNILTYIAREQQKTEEGIAKTEGDHLTQEQREAADSAKALDEERMKRAISSAAILGIGAPGLGGSPFLAASLLLLNAYATDKINERDQKEVAKKTQNNALKFERLGLKLRADAAEDGGITAKMVDRYGKEARDLISQEISTI